MPIVPVADWTPDQASYLNPNAQTAKGTFPRDDGADGPLRGAVVLSDALATAARGAFSAKDNAGISYIVAGTATKLLTLSGLSWTDRTPAPYTLATGQHWRFTQFGERVLATNYADEVQTWTLGAGGNFATLSASAPLAKYIATVEPGFVMLGFYNDGTVQSSGLWWSAINDATSWPTPGTSAANAVQSDYQILPGGGAITGILPAIGGASAAVFTERAIYRCEYVGSPAIFAFREIDRSRGCVAPQSLVQIGSVAYFLSEDGFCGFDGAQVRQIGLGRVDRFFWADVDRAQLERVYGTVDADRKIVVWAYPTANAANPNRWLIYSYAADRWRYADDAGVAVQIMMGARTAAYNLDTLDTVLPGGPDGAASVGFTVDSPTFQGGRRLLAGFDTSNRLVSFEGATLAARMETGDADEANIRVFVTGVRVLTDAVTPLASVGYRGDLSQTIQYSAGTTPGPDNNCPQRVSTQYARVRVDIPAGAAWTYLQGVDFQYTKAGKR